MKKINICDKEYDIDANAYTYIQFKQIFNRGLFQDIQVLKVFFSKQAEQITLLKIGLGEEKKELTEEEIDKYIESEIQERLLDYIDDFIDAITRLAYIFIYTANKEFASYEEFMKDIPKLSIDDDWVTEVTEFAVEKFC